MDGLQLGPLAGRDGGRGEVVWAGAPCLRPLIIPQHAWNPHPTPPPAGNFELNVVGDFDAAELEDMALAYVGTARAAPAPEPLHMHPIVFRNPPEQERHQTWHLKVGAVHSSAQQQRGLGALKARQGHTRRDCGRTGHEAL